MAIVLFYLWIFGMTVIAMTLFYIKCLDAKLIKNKSVLRLVKCVWALLILIVMYEGTHYFFTQLIYKLDQ